MKNNQNKKHLRDILLKISPGSYVPAPEEPDYNEMDIVHYPLSADDWQEFKRKFVSEYGNEPVQPTGMTHSEFMHYIKSSGDREGYDTRTEDILAILRRPRK